MKPIFEHDACEFCRFVGHLDGRDIWKCTQGGNLPTVIARYGDDGPEYSSGQTMNIGGFVIEALREDAPSLNVEVDDTIMGLPIEAVGIGIAVAIKDMVGIKDPYDDLSIPASEVIDDWETLPPDARAKAVVDRMIGRIQADDSGLKYVKHILERDMGGDWEVDYESYTVSVPRPGGGSQEITKTDPSSLKIQGVLPPQYVDVMIVPPSVS